MVEYWMILMFDYFVDTLADVRLHEVWLEWVSNCVAQIKNKYNKSDLNQIRKNCLV